MPAPIAAASPTRNVDHVLRVAKAAAKSGASVENRAVHEAGERRCRVSLPRGLVKVPDFCASPPLPCSRRWWFCF